MSIDIRAWFRKEARLLFPSQAFSVWNFASSADVLAGVGAAKMVSSEDTASLRGHGEVRLIKNGSNLQLIRYGAGFGRLLVAGTQVQISNAGPTLAPSFSDAAINTTYYIYCGSPTNPTLEASTTVPGYNGTYGVMVKSTDITKTLVGMARTGGTLAWTDTEAFRYVLSYFNRRQRSIYVPLTTDKTPSASNVEITTSTERAYFLTWADNPAVVGARVCCLHGSGNTGLYVMLNLDGTALVNSRVAGILQVAGYIFNNSVPPYAVDTTDGLHYIGLNAYSTGTASSQIYGATTPGTAIQGTVWG